MFNIRDRKEVIRRLNFIAALRHYENIALLIWDKLICRTWRKLSVSTGPFQPTRLNNNCSTNSKNLGGVYPFSWPMATGGNSH